VYKNKAKIFGLGLEAHRLGLATQSLGLGLELETYALLRDMRFSSTVICL